MEEIRLLEAAQKELDDAYDYYEAQATGLGSQFIDEMLGTMKSIRKHPEAWPVFSRRSRRCLVSRFPYSIIYQVLEDKILIVAIAHMHRKPEYWKDRL